MEDWKRSLANLIGRPEDRMFLGKVATYAFCIFCLLPLLTGLFLPDWLSLTDHPYAALPSRLILLLATGGASFVIVMLPVILLARIRLLQRIYVFCIFPVFVGSMAMQFIVYREFGTEIDAHVLGVFQGNLSALWQFGRREYHVDWLLVDVVLLSVGLFYWLGKSSREWRAPRLWPCIGVTSVILISGTLMIALQLGVARADHYHPSKMATAPLYQSVFFLGEHFIVNRGSGYREILEKAGEFTKDDEYEELTERLGSEPETFVQHTVAHPEWLKKKPSHVFFFVMESFGYDLLENPGLQNVAPYLRRFAKEGLVARNFSASSGSTIDAIHSSVSGAAAQASYPVPRALSQYKLDTLPKVMERAGFASIFLAASHRKFGSKGDSCEAYGYRYFIGCPDVAHHIQANEWGVNDGDFFRWARSQLGEMDAPHFVTFLNVSNHSPYDAPVRDLGEGIEFSEEALGRFVGSNRDEKIRFAKHVKFADWRMGEMAELLRTEHPDALFVFVGDHCSPKQNSDALRRIPFVLWNNRVINADVDTSGWYGSHMDILATLANLVLPEGESFTTLGQPVWSRSRDRVSSAGSLMITNRGRFNSNGEIQLLFSKTDPDTSKLMGVEQSVRKCSAINALSWGYLNGEVLLGGSSRVTSPDLTKAN